MTVILILRESVEPPAQRPEVFAGMVCDGLGHALSCGLCPKRIDPKYSWRLTSTMLDTLARFVRRNRKQGGVPREPSAPGVLPADGVLGRCHPLRLREVSFTLPLC